MNTYFNKMWMPLVVILGVLGLASCTDYLNKAPLSTIDPNDAFKNFRNFQGFTEQLYNAIPIMSESDMHNSFNWGEDEIWETGETRPFSYCVDQGDYWSWNTAGYSWLRTGGVINSPTQSTGDKGHLFGLCWQGIRVANIGIANLDKLNGATDEEKNLLAGQLYFFRGWFHFMLMQFWGGLPYIDQVLPSDQPLRLPRLNYQATADKAAADFQKAAGLLPVDWDQTATGKLTPGANNIRINKVMALAYLGKDLLWAGSPLMNSESTGSTTYNATYCKKAADAFGQALHICDSCQRYELVPFQYYSQLFYIYNKGSIPGSATVPDPRDPTKGHVCTEAIFMENLTNATGRWRWNQVNDYRPPCLCSSGLKAYPPANYVDYFGMANGLPIADVTQADPVSSYDPAYPWKGRDPRFYNDIIYDGVKCSVAAKTEDIQYASLFTAGTYRSATKWAGKAALTGYLNCKFTSQYCNDWDGYRENNAVVLSFMRLADVYLMYAEATAEGYGTPQSTATGYSLSAVGAINKVRDRAGVGHVDARFLGSTDNFMSEVRRERAVELAFEGHRFTDLRRWLLLTESPYTLKTSVQFDRANDVPSATLYANPQNGHVLNFKETVLLQRQLGTKHYWLPFLQSDVTIYAGFKQNPGW